MRALITGITGQDGSHLADLLLRRGHMVYGTARRVSENRSRIEHLEGHVLLLECDITDAGSVTRAIHEARPHEIYNLAAQSHVGASFAAPAATMAATGLGAVNVFEAARMLAPRARIYQASTSELFGNSAAPQNERTPMAPESPYAAAKLYAHQMADAYRRLGLKIWCGVLFNHEGPRRGRDYVTRKITAGLADIRAGRKKRIELGPGEPRRDWGYAPEYVEAMASMLQLPEPCDLVLGTGTSYSVRQFAQWACEAAGLDHDECVAYNTTSRPREVHWLQADATEAERTIGWKPQVFGRRLAELMVEHDMRGER